ESGVAAARSRGVNARQDRIDVHHSDLANDSFDIAICSVTLMMVMYPEILLSEMRRLAPTSIVSFINFGVIHNRVDMLVHGRMPRPMLFGYRWWETGHIHQLSVTDFHELCREVGLGVVDASYRSSTSGLLRQIYKMFPNVFTTLPIFKLQRVGPIHSQ